MDSLSEAQRTLLTSVAARWRGTARLTAPIERRAAETEIGLIVGPGEAKGEFMKRLKSKKLRSRIVELETTDKMTDRQLAAKVDEHFAKGTATPKRTANKPTKSSTTKRTKKAGK